MFRVVILLLLLVYTLAAPAALPQLDGRIVSGVPTTISSFPYQVSIQLRGSHFCGGSIYNEQTIITAAHCLLGRSASTLSVRVGSSFWNSGGFLVKVAKLKIHRSYNPLNFKNDVAIMRLAAPIIFKSTIKPIPLATIAPADGSSAIVSGWGTKKSQSKSLPTQLQAVGLKMVSLATCKSDVYGYGGQVRDTMICAYTEEKDAYQGDSGGPLVSDGKLVGVVSWGYGCAEPNLPGVYSDVAAFREWIESSIDSI